VVTLNKKKQTALPDHHIALNEAAHAGAQAPLSDASNFKLNIETALAITRPPGGDTQRLSVQPRTTHCVKQYHMAHKVQ
jgi:hypothetical protein